MVDESLPKSPADMGKVLVFVPSFNDHEHISRIAREVSELDIKAETLIVDDGSAVPITDSADALVFRVPDNLGLGVATNIALDHALRAGYRALVRIDADGQHAVEDIRQVLDPVERGIADMVVGVRSNHMVFDRFDGLMRTLVKGYFRLASGAATKGRAPRDVNTGFFAMNRSAMKALSGFEFERFPEPQMFILACRHGMRLEEVAVQQRERSAGRSTLTVSQAIRMVWRFSVFLMNEVLGPRRS